MFSSLKLLPVFLLGFLHIQAAVALSADDLTVQAPACKKISVASPKLRAARDAFETIFADLNGDGWCDMALAVPFPFNSKMETYFLDEMLILGGPKGWRLPFKGKGPPMFGLDDELWPHLRVDLTGIVLVYPTSGGAPFLLGLIDPFGSEKEFVSPGCKQYTRVHRWDAEVDAFKKVDDATRDSVLAFYYSKVEKPCKGKTKERQPGAKVPE